MEHLKTLAALIGFIADLFIFIDILKAKEEDLEDQSFSTWMLWGLLDAITTIAVILQHGNYELSAIYAFCSFSIATLLFVKNERRWGWLEWATSGGVLTCLVIWWHFGNQATTIAGTTAVVISGIPLAKQTYLYPEKAPTKVYLLFCAASSLSLLGAKNWSIEESLYAEATLGISIIFTILSLRKPKQKLRAIVH